MRKTNATLTHLWERCNRQNLYWTCEPCELLDLWCDTGWIIEAGTGPFGADLLSCFCISTWFFYVLFSLGWDLSILIFMCTTRINIFYATVYRFHPNCILHKGSQGSELCGPWPNFLRSNPVLPDQLAVMQCCGESMACPKNVQSCWRGGHWNFLKLS